MDIWVRRSVENYKKIQRAFDEFGMPVFEMTEENFLTHPEWDVYTFGKSPVAIDLMRNVKGLDFDQAFRNATYFVQVGIPIRTLSKEDLIKAKSASKRPKDFDDLDNI
ncbi:nucleotidyltransferase [Pararhodonellum marinum]|uniref:nucleotidyltransferase n=1 Tax=Pararhodonellum marinum TaxID=2755358 RepID=UPI001E620687|nr:nucleotidyltransferase [Pararhodonellum marinum]